MGQCCAPTKKRQQLKYLEKPDNQEIINKEEIDQDIQINLNYSRDARELQEIIMGTMKTKSCQSSLKTSHNVTEKFILNYNEQIVEQDFHPLQAALHLENINRFYDNYFKINKTETSGDGFKQTLSYQSLISEEELLQKREEFWETRIEGNQMSWQVIHSACEEEDQTTGEAILQAAGLILVKNTIQLSYDETGQRFCIPIFCINMPQSYQCKKKPTFIESFSESMITVFLRDQKKVNHEIKLSNQSTVEQLKTKFQQQFEKNTGRKVNLNQICLFYGGKLLQNQYQIGEYKISNEYVIQVLIKPEIS